ncbi:NAD(P)H-dependent flavin oxidoreductase [Streptomyces sp. GMR22]|uniref:NAD(P)H-dependent flavin oxidoreductase n=1 Tax=Streptomyces sp. GMR22 TaxID=2759524 RepID=UPI0015FC06A7|nr:nitronate monooxygenase [Streptomyces sp. GMR22]MBA6440766.1 nitronate monooxygenase [Streptomyces sp. GMR22]
MITTTLTRRLGIAHPVVSAGMARVAQADLVVAVSEAGGMGCLGGVSFMPDQLRAEIEKIKAGTGNPFAVNLLLPDSLTTEDEAQWEPVRRLWSALPEHDRARLAGVEALLTPGAVARQVEVVMEAAPPAVVLTFATPAWFIEECRKRGILVFALVGSVGKAVEASRAGVDFIVAQGSEGGGHTGYASTLALVPGVIDAVEQPVLAAGGIADGRGLAAVLSLGAVGAWVGTRFIASTESYGHDAFKQRVVSGKLNQVTLTRAYTGKPLRTFRNAWTDQWESRAGDIAAFPQQYAVAGTRVETGYQEGDLDWGMMPAGQSVQIIDEILPAGDIVRGMVAEAEEIISRLHGTVSG